MASARALLVTCEASVLEIIDRRATKNTNSHVQSAREKSKTYKTRSTFSRCSLQLNGYCTII
eukprot:scaffold14214_cov117-Skeletonema_menzelii.AAC.2